MGLYIKRAKMPETCMDCPCFNEEYGRCQTANNWDKGRVFSYDPAPRPDWCPLVEVPTQHDALVNVTRLLDIGMHLMNTAKNEDIETGVKLMWKYIIEAPIIIEPEDNDE